jgi:isopentenyldiphosphate isomerase
MFVAQIVRANAVSVLARRFPFSFASPSSSLFARALHSRQMAATEAAPPPLPPAAARKEEHFDILDETGQRTGVSRPRSEVHAQGLLHRAVHVWLYAPSTQELVLQRRASCKDSWPDRWDISSAGHLSAGEDSLPTAAREVEEELGLTFPPERFRFLFTHFERLESIQKGKPFKNFEFNDVYLVTLSAEERETLKPENSVIRKDDAEEEEEGAGSASASTAPKNSRWVLQGSEVSAVCYRPWKEVRDMYVRGDPTIVPTSDLEGSYARLFKCLEEEEEEAKSKKA